MKENFISLFVVMTVFFISSCNSGNQNPPPVPEPSPASSLLPPPTPDPVVEQQKQRVGDTLVQCQRLQGEIVSLVNQQAAMLYEGAKALEAGDIEKSNRKLAQSKTIEKKSSRLMAGLDQGKAELDKLAQSDNEDVRRAATSALDQLKQELEKLKQGKSSKR